ncbi:hypothetical protein Mapa_000244 [Marchantia paleacea]|nr:hypothetical protein Mapa_000244 [Marchantia paleacea]
MKYPTWSALYGPTMAVPVGWTKDPSLDDSREFAGALWFQTGGFSSGEVRRMNVPIDKVGGSQILVARCNASSNHIAQIERHTKGCENLFSTDATY